MISAIEGVSELVELCKLHGVKHFVVSPGSRNAPISITLENTNDISTYVVVDERSAAFFALGISLATNSPVVVVCTSGSAGLNYAPAIAEAYYQKIPLVVITADRPPEWINQGDGQTIMQDGMYGKHVLNSVTLPIVKDEDSSKILSQLVNELLLKANGKIKGPVHINVPFNEPLYLTKTSENKLPQKLESPIEKESILTDDLNSIIHSVNSEKKIMFIVGQSTFNTDLNSLINKISDLNQCVVLSETTSNIFGEKIISTIDRVIDGFSSSDKSNFSPDVLITFGDAVVSKKIKAWLRSIKPKEHIHVGYENFRIDTYSCLSKTIANSAVQFLAMISPNLIANDSDYSKIWISRLKTVAEKQKHFLLTIDWSDLKAFEIITTNLPPCNLHLGNSSPIRYVQLFKMNPKVRYYSNRGTSGIDGCTSTAAGFASVNNDLNVLITGDISFYYDSNALWNNYLKGNFKIILINNKGGNIFRIIDGPTDEKIIKKYFEAKHDMNAEYLCKQFGLTYATAHNENELKIALNDFLKIADKPGVLEIFTDNIKSPQILKDYFSNLKS